MNRSLSKKRERSGSRCWASRFDVSVSVFGVTNTRSNPVEQVNEDLVVFRRVRTEPPMLFNKVSTYTPHDQQHEEVRIKKKPGRGHRFSSGFSERGPLGIPRDRPCQRCEAPYTSGPGDPLPALSSKSSCGPTVSRSRSLLSICPGSRRIRPLLTRLLISSSANRSAT